MMHSVPPSLDDIVPRLLVPVVLLALSAACGSAGSTVLVASSLAAVAEELTQAWDPQAAVSEAGSHVLAAQVEAGVHADAVLLADIDIAQGLTAAGLAPPPITIATTGLSVLARPDADVGSVADLARPDVRLVLADAVVPLGGYTRAGLELLERDRTLGPGGARAVIDNARSLEDSARLVVAKLLAGQADAAIIYETDALRAVAIDPTLQMLPWPRSAQVEVHYTAQPLSRRGEELLRFLRSDAAAPIWQDHGFDPR